jgi:hypothetical protein
MALKLPDGTVIDESDIERGDVCDGAGCDRFLTADDNGHEVDIGHFVGEYVQNQNSPAPSNTKATVCDDCVKRILNETLSVDATVPNMPTDDADTH